MVAVLVVLVIRIAGRDRSIRGIRLGVFYERQRDEDADERQERLPRRGEK